MPKKKVASNFGLGKSLIKTRTVKAKQWSQGDEGPTGGFKVVSNPDTAIESIST